MQYRAHALNAREIADIGVSSGCEFDISSSVPMTIHVGPRFIVRDGWVSTRYNLLRGWDAVYS